MKSLWENVIAKDYHWLNYAAESCSFHGHDGFNEQRLQMHICNHLAASSNTPTYLWWVRKLFVMTVCELLQLPTLFHLPCPVCSLILVNSHMNV
jgi:hypothetical protein